MKKHIQKISTISSTGKLFIFIIMLLVVILFASSSIYIQYRSQQVPDTREFAKPSDADTSAKNEIQAVAPASGSASSVNAKNSGAVDTAQPSSALRLTDEAAKCTQQKIERSVVHRDVSWLKMGESTVVPGRDGYVRTCPGAAPYVVAPIDKGVYRGTQLLTILPTLLDTVAEDSRNLPLVQDLGL